MAFGQLVNKFCILNGKREGSLDKATAILPTCERLHNYIIHKDDPFEHVYQSVKDEIDSLKIKPNPSATLGMSYLPVMPDNC